MEDSSHEIQVPQSFPAEGEETGYQTELGLPGLIPEPDFDSPDIARSIIEDKVAVKIRRRDTEEDFEGRRFKLPHELLDLMAECLLPERMRNVLRVMWGEICPVSTFEPALLLLADHRFGSV